ncbi:hypothetical protein MTR_7g092645 [Medicago truncatula]|uniref:Uncharacterized protein n=1 Tax=Medicago truncatula TaxID=3880 RepID=A0A072UCT1_MEDTR|nr:hypothetical protein MTR_7g092645 [Medicago truncatula]
MVEFKREKRKYAEFSHNDLKYVEFCGCVFSADVIELASQLLRNANSLNKMTFSSLHKFYIGAGRWTSGSDGCLLGQNVIYEMLKDEVQKGKIVGEFTKSKRWYKVPHDVSKRGPVICNLHGRVLW